MDMVLKVLQTISPNMSLTLPSNQRTAKGREKVASKLAKEFRALILKVPPKEITIDKYKEMVYSLIPSIKPSINVVQNENKSILGAVSIDGRVEYQEINEALLFIYDNYKVKFNLYNDIIASTKSTIVHETRHLLDDVCSPKDSMGRFFAYVLDNNVSEKKEDIDNYVKFSPNSISRKSLQEKLSGLNLDAMVAILQRLRHYLRGEVNAYREEYLFGIQQCPNVLSKIKSYLRYYSGFTLDAEMQRRLNIVTKELKTVLRNRHNP